MVARGNDEGLGSGEGFGTAVLGGFGVAVARWVGVGCAVELTVSDGVGNGAVERPAQLTST